MQIILILEKLAGTYNQYRRYQHKNDHELKGLTNKFQIYQDYRIKEIERIRSTYETIDPDLLFSVAERIKRAKTIHIYGHKVSHIAAKFMELRLKTIGFKIQWLTPWMILK